MVTVSQELWLVMTRARVVVRVRSYFTIVFAQFVAILRSLHCTDVELELH